MPGNAPPSRHGWGSIGLLAAWAVMALAWESAALAEPTFPALTGRIVDEAALLGPEDRAAIEGELAALEQKSTDQVAVVTLKSLQGYEIEDFGYRLGRHWGIGQKGKDNGILLIVAPNERKVRIEVGRGLEPVMTDALSKLIVDNAIVPEFRRGDFPAGIRAGVRDIMDVLLGDAEAVKERARSSSRGEGMDLASILLLLFWLTVAALVIWAIVSNARTAQPAAARRRGRGVAPVVVPGDSGGWNGGWSSGDGNGGGGWSGGGGGFGGGGSSGSW